MSDTGASGGAAEGATEGDRRGSGRRTVMIPATIRCPDGQEFACVLRDMSAGGARLSVSRRHRLPKAFELAVPGRAAAYPVRRAWRSADAVGVALKAAQPEEAPGATS